MRLPCLPSLWAALQRSAEVWNGSRLERWLSERADPYAKAVLATWAILRDGSKALLHMGFAARCGRD